MSTANSNNSGGSIIAKSTTTTILPDGSQRTEEVTKIRNADGTIREQKVIRNVPAAAVVPPPPQEVTTTTDHSSDVDFRDDGGDSMSEISQNAGSTVAVVTPQMAPLQNVQAAQPMEVQEADPIVYVGTITEETSMPSADVSAPSVDYTPDYSNPNPSNVGESFSTGDGYPPAVQHPPVAAMPTAPPQEREGAVQYGIGIVPSSSISHGQAPPPDPQPKASNTNRRFWTRNKKIGAGVVVVAIVGALAAALGVLLSGNDSPAPSPDRSEGPPAPGPVPAPAPSPDDESCATFTLDLQTDPYSNETSWEVVDTTANSVEFSGGPYEYGGVDITESECLPTGSYRFTIRDANGDGICCNYGEGKYGLKMGDKTLRSLSNGEFGPEESIVFYITPADATEVSTIEGADEPTKKPTPSPTKKPTADAVDVPGSSDATPSPTAQPVAAPIPPTEQPVVCANNVRLVILPDENTGGPGGDEVEWEIFLVDPEGNAENDELVLSSNGPLLDSDTVLVEECLTDGTYRFTITDSGGDGFGDDLEASTGYFFFAGDYTLGGMVTYLHQDEFTFTLPYTGDEDDGDNYDACSTDFQIGISTGLFPEDVIWEVTNDETGEVMVQGGPYDRAFGVFTSRACLPDGAFTFNIDVGSNGSAVTYFLFIESELVVDSTTNGRDFGESDTQSFSLPPLAVVATQSPTPGPTVAPTPKPTSPIDSMDECSGIQILIVPDANTGGVVGDTVTWDLILEDPNGDVEDNVVVLSSDGPLESDDIVMINECVPSGRYTFVITDSGGDGFGDDEEDTVGYLLTDSDSDMPIGGSTIFFSEDRMTFSLPYDGDEPDSNPDSEVCASDFVFVLLSNGSPEDISWEVVNDETGNVVAYGGPYELAYAGHTHAVCLPDGDFTFTINVGPNGLYSPGFYMLYVENIEIVGSEEGVNFGSTDAHSFALPMDESSISSGDTLTSMPTSRPTNRPTARPTARPTTRPTTEPTPAPIASGFTGDDSTECSNIELIIIPDSNTGGIFGDDVEYQLILLDPDGNVEDNEVVLESDGPLENDDFIMINECVPNGRYTFVLSDSGGDGFGNSEETGETVGYLISSNEASIGGSTVFFTEDRLTFSLPYAGDEPDSNPDTESCSSDLAVVVLSNESPQSITWEVVDDATSEVLVYGGPYELAYAGYTHKACLPDGDFTFTINVGSSGLSSPSFYMMYVEGTEIVGSEGGEEFGSTDSHSFSLPLVSTVSSTTAPTAQPTPNPTVQVSSGIFPEAECSNIEIIIVPDVNTGNTDDVTWELVLKDPDGDEDNDEIILSSDGPLENSIPVMVQDCIPNGSYEFVITDSAGDGFGDAEDATVGYLITSNDISVGGASLFFHEDILSFALPYTGDEPDNNLESESCASDFVLALFTTTNPEDITWQVIDDSTDEVVVQGGPYDLVYGGYTHGACLPDGSFTFTIDFGPNGLYSPGFYLVFIEGEVLVDSETGQDIEETDTHSFVLPLGSVLPIESSPNPTRAPTPKPTGSTANSGFGCYDVRVSMKTDVATGGGSKGDVTEWELFEKSSGEIVLSGGPLGSNRTYVNDKCLEEGLYTFRITDSGGDGFGDLCEDCGYFISVGEYFVGGSVSFYDHEELTFPVPFYGDEPDGDDYDHCTGDFYFALVTDEWPEETTWELLNDNGDVFLSGGPYEEAGTIYTQRACLPDNEGPFAFTIFDSAGDGIRTPGLYVLMSEGNELVDGSEGTGSFGSSNTTVFSVGNLSRRKQSKEDSDKNIQKRLRMHSP